MSVPLFDEAVLKSISDILGDTHSGFSGWEIAEMLARCEIEDPGEMTKRIRLFEALHGQQLYEQNAKRICVFIEHAMNPVKYVQTPDWFFSKREQLNRALAFQGLFLGENGKLQEAPKATSLSKKVATSDVANEMLANRNIHPDVLAFCENELTNGNYFHAVLEATKSVAEKIRNKTGLRLDGAKLIQRAIQTNPPRLALNTMETQSEQDEQRGFGNLLTGLFLMYRNPLSHEPRSTWSISKDDAIDVLSFISLIHRRIDSADASDGAL